jgi:hypothetical protein
VSKSKKYDQAKTFPDYKYYNLIILLHSTFKKGRTTPTFKKGPKIVLAQPFSKVDKNKIDIHLNT